MKRVILLAVLIGCQPQTQVVAPVVAHVEPQDSTPALGEQPTEHVQWTVGPEEDFFTTGGITSKYEAIYRRDETMVVATTRNGVLRVDCSNGTITLNICKQNDAKFTFVCNDVSIKISCRILTNITDSSIQNN